MPASTETKPSRAKQPQSDSNSENESLISQSSSSPAQKLDVEHNGSRKRRRLSPAADESDSEDDEPRLNTIPSATTGSRIKSRISAPIEKIDNTPATIQESTKQKTSFAAINVDPWLVRSLANMAIKHPTDIQKGCIPEILKGRDCIGGSRTGSGKTVAFAVPILQTWARDPMGIYAVVLTPTRYVFIGFCHLGGNSC